MEDLYLPFWKTTLIKIRNEFQAGKSHVRFDVKEIASIGDRSSYAGNAVFRFGNVVSNTGSAPFRDLIKAVKTLPAIKPFLAGELTIRISGDHQLTASFTKGGIADLIAGYKKLIEKGNRDIYKWNLLGRPHFDLEAADFAAMIRSIDFRNLIFHNARGVLRELSDHYPEEVRAAFRNLFDESKDLRQRILDFRGIMETMYRRRQPVLATHQDERSIATYLTYFKPEKYSLYKESFYSKYCRFLNIKPAAVNGKYIHYLQLVSELIEKHIRPDEALQQAERDFTPEGGFADPNHTLLAQDILYQTLEMGGGEDTEEPETDSSDVRYFVGGSAWNDGDHTKEFIEGGYWENSYQDDYTDLVRQIPVGSFIAIKSSFATKARESFLRIKCVGEVVENAKDGLTLYVNWQQPFLAFDINGLGKYRSTVQEITDPDDIRSIFHHEPKDQEMNITATAPAVLNTILYGPPGTGKTYRLQGLIDEMQLVQKSKSLPQDFSAFVSGFSWWQLLAMALLQKKKSPVPELLEHPLIKAKLAISSIQHPPQRVWSTLQHHTVKSCPNVKGEKRFGELVFFKEADSDWRLDNEAEFIQQFPYLIAEWENFTKGNSAQKEQRNYTFITCHQSLSYEDFIEGIKPVLEQKDEAEPEEKLQYQVRKGLFYQACEKAAQLAGFATLKAALEANRETRKRKFREAKEKNLIYVLFLDEISRCNVSAVFGELITLIEEDKRLGAENEIADIFLPYSQSLFGVPFNLFIVGTMNTADRSVEALDTALRRRFVFEAMMPKPELLSPYHWLKKLWDEDNKTPTEEFERNKVFPLEKVFNVKISRNAYHTLDERVMKLSGEEEKQFNREWAGIKPEEFFKDVFVLDDAYIDRFKLLSAINKRLAILLSNDHTVGHAWLMNATTLPLLQQAFKSKIIPLLQEYFYNSYAKIGLVLGDAFVKTTKVKENLFAAFADGDDTVEDYKGKTVYTLVDPNTLDEKAFRSIYE